MDDRRPTTEDWHGTERRTARGRSPLSGTLLAGGARTSRGATGPRKRLIPEATASAAAVGLVHKKSIAHMAGDRRILLPARHGTGAEADSRPPRSPRSLVRSFAQPRSCVPGRAPRAARPRPLLRPTSTRARRTCRRLCAYASSGPGAVRVWAEGCVCRRGRIGGVSVC